MTPQEIIQGIDQLFSLPDVVIRLNELLESETATLDDIGEVIGTDPALTARLLKLVNSAFYGFPSQIDTLPRAVMLIGTNEVRNIVLASSATSVFSGISSDLIDMDSFWHRSVYCGLIAKKLAGTTRRSRGETQFLTGLLHDVGKLVLIIRDPAHYETLMRSATEHGTALADLEEEWLGFSSAEIGAALLEHWQLPQSLVVPVRFQYHPEATDSFVNEAHILSLAIRITDCLEPELKTDSRELDLDQLDSIALDDFKLGREDLNLIATDASLEALEILSIINPGGATIY